MYKLILQGKEYIVKEVPDGESPTRDYIVMYGQYGKQTRLEVISDGTPRASAGNTVVQVLAMATP